MTFRVEKCLKKKMKKPGLWDRGMVNGGPGQKPDWKKMSRSVRQWYGYWWVKSWIFYQNTILSKKAVFYKKPMKNCFLRAWYTTERNAFWRQKEYQGCPKSNFTGLQTRGKINAKILKKILTVYCLRTIYFSHNFLVVQAFIVMTYRFT